MTPLHNKRGHYPRQREDSAVASPYEQAPRLVFGMQPVREAIRAHGSRLGSVLVERVAGDAAGRFDALERVARRDLDALSSGGQHQGAAAWAPALHLIDSATALGAPGLLVVALDGIQDPQNFGAVIRSAVGLGATSVVWGEHSSAPLTPATFRASAGAVEHARLCRVSSLVRFMDEAVATGAQVIGLAPDATMALHEADLSGPTILVIGSEHEGLNRAVRHRCTLLARLTLRGPIESLNASAACAAALYVSVIQRAKSNG
jgi:23S rRNA (guanosine2251-2'-O)-methyltransferase